MPRRFHYGARPHHGDHFSRRHGFPARESYIHFEPRHFVIPHSEKEGMKPPYVCPGCSNHTYSNNMITRFHVQ
jgi:hypothetical protein